MMMMIKEKECTVHRKDKDISNNNDEELPNRKMKQFFASLT